MKSRVERFIDQLAASSFGLKEARNDVHSASVGNEAVAPLTLLALGHRLADDAARSDAERNEAAFDTIERAFADGDPDLSAASGRVIEAAVARAVDLETWPDLRLRFGERSGAHALNCIALDR
ncbi:hypothetical protein OSH08_06465 [Kaistia geumhonensis]|uniref:Uncharacterized protein n=1 Tax=Kaistia geumhonensis TaxID=410839 RepID=A0ABU0M597_9HYPH|nr:hypothetical protein [Kaistia geumhonensis]MCX5478640.1 hypothetical protein [Kaistia geumhonensis]MDQ0516142.1 hypothetical protein [Kaistia geumhonensis]